MLKRDPPINASVASDTKPSRRRRTIRLALIGGLLAAVTLAVLLTGGTRYAYLHAMYIPILLGGIYFGISGGIIAALFGGLLLGPLMPLDSSTGEMQATVNWLTRMAIFTGFGAIAALLLRQLRLQQERAQWLAYHHTATGLPNRLALTDTLERLAAEGGAAEHTLLMIDIKNIDQIINGLGPHIRTPLIEGLCARLRERTPAPERVFELSARRLAMIVPTTARAAVDGYVRQVHEIPEQELEIAGIPVYIDLTIGAIDLGREELPPNDLLQRAYIAVFEAQRRGVLYASYPYETENWRKRNLERLAGLPRAIRNNELRLHYQPKVDLARRHTVGVEALLRWLHPREGLIPPGEFIPLAENTGLIHPLTRWVVREAIAEIARLREAGHELSMAVNMSVRNLADPELFEYIGETLARHGLPPSCLELEITESAILESLTGHVEGLVELRRQGVTISIDDFGAGYTSLGYLTELPINSLKIDQLFIRDLHNRPQQQAIVQAIIQLADNLGLTSVAEGVEDTDTGEQLRRMGCTLMQGFAYSRPLTANALREWLADTRWPCQRQSAGSPQEGSE